MTSSTANPSHDTRQETTMTTRPTAPTPILARTVRRRLAGVEQDTAGHWRWRGSHTWDGYARLRVRVREDDRPKVREMVAHRAAWLVLVGPIPERHVLRSTCGVRDCVRPEHHEQRPYDWSPYDDMAEVGAAVDATSDGGKAA